MQKIIMLLIFDIFVKICLQYLNINYKIINILKLILFNFFVFAREKKTTIFQILNKIN